MNIHFHMSASPPKYCSSAILHINWLFFSFKAGLDKMAKGHMLADVVAIIGEKAFQPLKGHKQNVWLFSSLSSRSNRHTGHSVW